MPQTRWAGLAMREHTCNSWASPYWRYICNIKEKLGIPYLASKDHIKSFVTKYFLNSLNSSIASSNLVSMRPISSLSRAAYVCEDSLSSLIAGVKVNYCSDYQCQGRDRSRKCPVCPYNVKSSEFHVLFECPAVLKERKLSGLQDFINICRFKNIQLADCFYLFAQCKDSNSCDLCLSECMNRARAVKFVRDQWYERCIVRT